MGRGKCKSQTQKKVKYVQRYSEQDSESWRDNTHTLVIEECLERDMGEDFGICSTDTKQETETQH